MLVMPESPRWQASKGRFQEMVQVLTHVREAEYQADVSEEADTCARWPSRTTSPIRAAGKRCVSHGSAGC